MRYYYHVYLGSITTTTELCHAGVAASAVACDFTYLGQDHPHPSTKHGEAGQRSKGRVDVSCGEDVDDSEDLTTPSLFLSLKTYLAFHQ